MGNNRVWTGKWKGGRTFNGKDGRPVFVLRKMVQGRAAYTVHLDARSETEAEAELALFMRDPEGYSTKREARQQQQESTVYVNAETVGRSLDSMRQAKTTERYVGNIGFYSYCVINVWLPLGNTLLQRLCQAHRFPRENELYDTVGLLGDVGRSSLGEGPAHRHPPRTPAGVGPAQDGQKEPHYGAQVVCFLVEGARGPLPGRRPHGLPEGARDPSREGGAEKGYSIETTERLYRAISGWEFTNFGQEETRRTTDVQCVRDVVCIHAKTGMHGTEIERLARGEGKVAVFEDQGEIAATITFIHKSGNVHRQSIDRQTLAAVQRLQARGAAPVDSHIRRVVARACETLGIEPVHFGEYRHSFVTWASECGQEVRPKAGGLPLAAIAAVVGHHSANTTKRFYDNVKVPPMIKLPIKLEHPDDPALLPVRRAQIRLVESA